MEIARLHYLDNAATTPVSKAAAEAVCSALTEYYANPSSLYDSGAVCEAALESARSNVADAMGCKAKNIYFTASGSEGNNIAILGAAKTRNAWGRHIIITSYEHSSVRECVNALETAGFSVTRIEPNKDGNIDINAMISAVTDKTILVSAMHVNNETGAVIDVERLAKEVKAKNSRTAVHIDGVQALGKLALALDKTSIDSYAVSGHKINAPKGVGALYLRTSYHILPVLYGGGQEGGMRPGTQNVAYALALGKEAKRAGADRAVNARHIDELYNALMNGLGKIDDIIYNSPSGAVHGIVNISAGDVKSETMLHYLDAHGVMVSGGSACSKGKPSHTLTAMGFSEHRIATSLRISFGTQNTQQDVNALCEALASGLDTLAKIGEKSR